VGQRKRTLILSLSLSVFLFAAILTRNKEKLKFMYNMVVQISNTVISTQYVDCLTGTWLSDANTDLPNSWIKTLISEWDKCLNVDGDQCWLLSSMATTLAGASHRELSSLNNVLSKNIVLSCEEKLILFSVVFYRDRDMNNMNT
jgi:hypothetical protein